MLGVVNADVVEAIQMENIFYRAVGHMESDGTDHHNGTLISNAERSATPAQLIGNRIKRTPKKIGENKFGRNYDYESY